MGEYRLTPKAEADRDWIVEDGLSRWGKRRVEAYVNELQGCFEQLEDFPRLGTSCDDIRQGYRCLPVGEHYVYYRIDDDGVIVVRIRLQRRLPRADMLDEGNPAP
jgi:toxin ParE1/3/4